MVTELRTVAADSHWLSSSYGHDVVGLHFTWVRDVERVYAVLPLIEAALLPLGARPHWGKCFVAEAAQLEPLYPRIDDFRDAARQGRPGGQVRQRLPRPRHRLTSVPPTMPVARAVQTSPDPTQRPTRRPHTAD